MANLKSSSNPAAATAFITLVLSPLGQRVLRDNQFVPVVDP
jgi:ABC-type molybdate transport system substrate-binding protein